MSNVAALGAIEYEAESSWAEAVTTTATHRLPHIGASIDTSGLTHAKEEPGHVEQYRGAGSTYFLGAQGGSFEITMDLPGHGATTSGSPSVDAIETFLGLIFGTAPSLSASASTTLTGGTATAPTTTASGTFSAGGLCRVGVLGDGDGDGQMYRIGTHVTTTLNLSTALRGAPVNGAVLLPVVQLIPPSAPTSGSITSVRFLLLTANMHYRCHGCFPMSVSFTGLAPGGRPQIKSKWGVSRWSEVSATFPSAVTQNRYMPAVVAAGSLHVQDVGTATRNELSCRDFQVDYTLGVEVLKGPAGVGQYQDIVGARRVLDDVKVSFVVDADATTASPVLPGWGRGTTNHSIMYTLSPTAGSAVGFWFPKVCDTTVPTQMSDGNINRFKFEGRAHCSDTTTSELTLARMVLGLG